MWVKGKIMATADFEKPKALASSIFGDKRAITISNPPVRSSSEIQGFTHLNQRRWQRGLERRRNREIPGQGSTNKLPQEPMEKAQKPVFLTAREIGGTATEAMLRRIRQLQNEIARKHRELGGKTYRLREETKAERAELKALNAECGQYQSRFAVNFETQAARIRREKNDRRNAALTTRERRQNGKTK